MNNRDKKKLFCKNCGEIGHIYKKCTDPTTSFGIIALKIDSLDKFNDNIISSLKKKITSKVCDIISTPKTIPYDNLNIDTQSFCFYKNNIKFLLIRRKHTLGYLEFMRGRYQVDNEDGIIFLFQQMTKEEQEDISKKTFEQLWIELWENNNYSHENEYKISKDKFMKLKNKSRLEFYVNEVTPNFNTPEWGFPKGRRDKNKINESNLGCALREFEEETGFTKNDLIILDDKYTISEEFHGTNGVRYKHVYYLALTNTDKEPIIDENNHGQKNEIGGIGWFSHQESRDLIRPYHTERKKILDEIYMYIINKIICIRRDVK
ncbi:MAG: hypothetical protein CMF62_02705 [Magnetococcales bacterium]|nr:hypothetical protein [Magnetococcales bacterium]|tara:strand:+ start:48292 stop:49248 length:957 start_codon:yes stop_codon:yes gene_type:complete